MRRAALVVLLGAFNLWQCSFDTSQAQSTSWAATLHGMLLVTFTNPRTSSARVGSDFPKTFRSVSFTSGRNHHRSCRCPIAAASCTYATRTSYTAGSKVAF